MSIQHRIVTVLSALSMLAIAFASVAADKSTDAFPIGSYQHKQTIVVFKPDGTFLGTTPKGEDWVKGTYTNKGNEFTVIDTWEGNALKDEDCKGKEGRYTWTKTGKVLTAHLVDDACEGRKHGTDGVAWTQVKSVKK